jgi:hypothetical protein
MRTLGWKQAAEAVMTMWRSPLALAQQRQEGLDRIDHAHDVHRQDPVPILLGQLVDRAELLDADIGAEHLAGAEFGPHRLGGGRDRGGVCDVDLGRDRLRPAPAQLGGLRRGALAVDVQERRIRALAGEQVRHGGAQPGARSRDDRRAARIFSHSGLSLGGQDSWPGWSIRSRVTFWVLICQPASPFT